MKILFEDTGIEELIKNGSSKKYKKIAKNKAFVEDLRVVYSILLSANKTADLAKYKSLHYEKLKYNMSGFSSVRISFTKVERLIFRELSDGVEIVLIEIDDTHYGNKK